MVEPGITLTGDKKYTNFYIYKGRYVYIQEDCIYSDKIILLKAFSILQFFIADNTLFCVTKNACVIIYNLMHNIVVKLVETNLPTLSKAILMRDTLYFITERKVLFESPLRTLQFSRSNYGRYEDRFTAIDKNASIEKYLVDFKEFLTKFVLYNENTLFLVDVFNRIYAYKRRLMFVYHHYLEIIDIKIVKGLLIIIDQHEDVVILKDNIVVTKVHLKTAEAILDEAFISCKDGIFNLNTCCMALFKDEYEDLHFYRDSFFGKKKIGKSTKDTIINIPTRKNH
ncbi:hypothetical protein BDAP_002609 [Binucleata daphniae]